MRILTALLIPSLLIPSLLPCFLAGQSLEVKLKPVAEGLTAPVAMDAPRDGTGRIFICEQTGKIKIIKNGKVLEKAFLDLKEKIDAGGKAYSEKGLLGIAFHPRYKINGKFYVYYNAATKDRTMDHRSVISELKVSANADIADYASEKIIMSFEQPEPNHNGGQLAFGPDGFLYIGSGDGGGAGDQHGSIGNAQDLTTVLGKILRIDVDGKSPYAIPPANPFVNTAGSKPEVWAYGLRNPWRFSFDRKTGKLFCADVGQNEWEEVDVIEGGKNYGWRVMEGNHCYDPPKGCNLKGLERPIAEYSHETGICITGGYVYRGSAFPSLTGKYIFGDWKGKLFALEEIKGKWTMKNLALEGKKDNDCGMNINSFGEDEKGEIYLLVQKTTGTLLSNGAIYVISKP